MFRNLAPASSSDLLNGGLQLPIERELANLAVHLFTQGACALQGSSPKMFQP